MAVSILFIWIGTMAGLSFSLAWSPPDGYTPNAYILLHGTTSGAYTDWNNAGTNNVFEWTSGIPSGVNYFSSIALSFDTNGVLQMSGLSNEILVTNTPQVIITTVILSSTNIPGAWSPWSTNSVQFSPSLPQEFFKLDSLKISSSNQITIQAPK